VVSREVRAHPTLPDVFTMGECLTEDHLSDFSGPDTTRSTIVLYWGSFAELARRDETFDWGEELWETLTHELRHHLESLARDEALEGVDYAADETFKRDEGLAFDPWYYQRGDDLGGGVYRVEKAFYLEQVWDPEAFARARTIEFPWRGGRYRVPRPEELGDIHFVMIEDLEKAPGTLELVLVRRRGWWSELKRVAGMRRPVVLESVAGAEPVEGTG
jgi:hypothetical protein